jgi:hypothetical protein
MPDPRTLKVGDRVRFIAIPDEWSEPDCCVDEESRAFMEAIIRRRHPSRIREIDESGMPWITARMKGGEAWVHHGWGISESTGWRLVKP